MRNSRLLVCLPREADVPIVVELSLLNLQRLAAQMRHPAAAAPQGAAETWDACWASVAAACKFVRQFPSVAAALQAVTTRRADWNAHEHQQLCERLHALESTTQSGDSPSKDRILLSA